MQRCEMQICSQNAAKKQMMLLHHVPVSWRLIRGSSYGGICNMSEHQEAADRLVFLTGT
ncbi:hypothetical protein LDENG_00260580 [Lucifuga dentata]|nr:hypothetical protein LDENG_00260580 [Lucifuga dentata]